MEDSTFIDIAANFLPLCVEFHKWDLRKIPQIVVLIAFDQIVLPFFISGTKT